MAYSIFKRKVNKRNIEYGLAIDKETGHYGVYKMCENYCSASQKTGLMKSWRYVEKGMTQEAAETLYNRRSA
jgi:hypothetical protein